MTTRPADSVAPEPCSGCKGRRWAEDENWQPSDPRTWDGSRSHGDGLIPCGFCNEGGWDTPDFAPDADSAAPEPRKENDMPEMEWAEAATLYGDIIVALAAARLWLVGEYADRPRSEFNAEAWQRLVDRVGRTISDQPSWWVTARTFRIVEGSE